MRVRFLAIALVGLSLCACDPGSRSISEAVYTIDYKWSQSPTGTVVITGRTDLPDGTQVDGLVTKRGDPAGFVNGAVLNGTTTSLFSQPVRRPSDASSDFGTFKISLAQAVAETCHGLPPCGPFPAGDYYIVLDAHTPRVDAQGISTYQDPRFMAATHGYGGFPGIEIVARATLKPILVRIDKDGHQLVLPVVP